MRLVPDLDSPATRSRTVTPFAYHERAISRDKGCWPGALDARCTPYAVRVMPRSAHACAEPGWVLRGVWRWLRYWWGFYALVALAFATILWGLP